SAKPTAALWSVSATNPQAEWAASIAPMSLACDSAASSGHRAARMRAPKLHVRRAHLSNDESHSYASCRLGPERSLLVRPIGATLAAGTLSLHHGRTCMAVNRRGGPK